MNVRIPRLINQVGQVDMIRSRNRPLIIDLLDPGILYDHFLSDVHLCLPGNIVSQLVLANPSQHDWVTLDPIKTLLMIIMQLIAVEVFIIFQCMVTTYNHILVLDISSHKIVTLFVLHCSLHEQLCKSLEVMLKVSSHKVIVLHLQV